MPQSVEDLEALRRSADLCTELVGALAVFLQLLGCQAAQVVEEGSQRQTQGELPAPPLGLVGQMRDERERPLEVVDGLATGQALAGAVRGSGKVAKRAQVITALLEVGRKLGGDLRGALAVRALPGLADPLVQTPARARLDRLADRLPVELVREGVAECHAPVGPIDTARETQEALGRRQCFE